MAFDFGYLVNTGLQNLFGGQTGAQINAPTAPQPQSRPPVTYVNTATGQKTTTNQSGTGLAGYLTQSGFNAAGPGNTGSGSGSLQTVQTDGGGAPQVPDYASQLYGQINSLYDNLSSGLAPQRDAQEQIINNNFEQGKSDLNANLSQGNAQLDTQSRKNQERKVSTLRDLTDNLRNQMQAGQVFLGAKGAGDSSAADQYSYALTQLGNKSRGNVLGQTNSVEADIGDKRSQLQAIYTQESNRLQTEVSNQKAQLAQWYASAQNQIGQLKGQAQISASQQILQSALSALQNIDAQAQAKTSALQQWAVGNAQTLQQAVQGLNQASAYQAPNLTLQALGGQPIFGSNSGNQNVTPLGIGAASNPGDTKYDRYGNPVY